MVVKAAKFPDLGKRSLTGALPHFGLWAHPAKELMENSKESGSTLFIMIETRGAFDSVNDLAAEPGCDVLMVGCRNLSMEIGMLGE